MPIASTQQFVPIAQIKQGVLILKNGGLRAILEVTPVNFALKSQQDQEVLTGQFQNFLNSLEFPLQMTVQSRRLDVFPYLKGLADYSQNISSNLLRLHAFDYIGFVQKLTELANIMEKKFFCVVPYEARPLEHPGMLKKLFSSRARISINQSQFERYRKELDRRVQVVSGGLESMGLRVKRLNSQAIIEEFYYVFNPEEAQEERLQNLEQISAPIIKTQKSAISQQSTTIQNLQSKLQPTPEVQTPIDNLAHKLNPQKPATDQRTGDQPALPSQPAPADSSQPIRSDKSKESIASADRGPSPQAQPSAVSSPAPDVRPPQSEAPAPDPVIDSQIKQDAQNILKNLR